ncbi:MAG: transcriptional repressor LexA [Alphaproteobacteria bacterium]|nr:MAG: transcriptional repressor LexA [Alphaproteobacteria bacterium]
MLTPKQHELLRFIQRRIEESGVAPSFEEMKDAMGLRSKSGIHRLITALEERGFIRRLPNRARAVELLRPLPEQSARNTHSAAARVAEIPAGSTESRKSATLPPTGEGGKVLPFTPRASHAEDVMRIPLHGKIAAGTPIEAIEQVDSYLELPPAMLPGTGPHFALTVEGDSMVEAGILDGDTVLIQSCDVARDGEIVVALVDNEEATLKTLKRLGHHVALIPANRHHETRMLEADRVKVQGRLVGLIRRYH